MLVEGTPGAPWSIDVDAAWFNRFSERVDAVQKHIAGQPLLDPLTLLLERAQMLGHRSWGSVSAGGSCRLFHAVDGVVAVNLPRDEDVAMVPALLDGVAVADGQVWKVLEQELAVATVRDIEDRAELLGMAVAGVGTGDSATLPRITVGGGRRPAADPMRVIDLSSLWAGPLCGKLLAAAGASVTKVESLDRPDGARAGTPAFYKHMNGQKTVKDIRFDVDHLGPLLAQADVVIEASRPRALAQLGIDPATHVDNGVVWCSVTGWGRTGGQANRVAFGDDAAAAAGLVAQVPGDESWVFVGDAIADPITGVSAAAMVLDAWTTGRGALIDVSMVGAVRSLLNPTQPNR